jgi:hypothetical protein
MRVPWDSIFLKIDLIFNDVDDIERIRSDVKFNHYQIISISFDSRMPGTFRVGGGIATCA